MDWDQIKLENGVWEIQANSWRGFVSFVQSELSHFRAYIFRGQREPEWKLLPSLDRIPGMKTLRNDTLGCLKEASRGRRGSAPPSLSDDEWWALGQHHGLKTPLLDWTQSPFVAAFFAFLTERNPKDLPKDRVVYGLAKQQVVKKSEEVKKNEPGTLLTGTDTIEVVSPLVDDNMRLVNQSGLFTKSLGVNIEIEDWVRKRFKGDNSAIMIKMNISESTGDRHSFLRFLNRMNINHLTLFPDLDGAAKYCNMKLEIDDY